MVDRDGDKVKKRLVYIWSLRNAAADRAGQQIAYKGGTRYMKSVLESLVEALETTVLGDLYSLETIIFDDDSGYAADGEKLREYGFVAGNSAHWFFPPQLEIQGRSVASLMQGVPSSYRRYAKDDPRRLAGKASFEARVQQALVEARADVVLLDGLLIILDTLIRPKAVFHNRIVNIHPGITSAASPYRRRGAHATWDALYGARGMKVIDWQTMQTQPVPVCDRTGASLHYVDAGIDSGEVIHEALHTTIAPDDTILELRWNNFNHSLFPVMRQGLAKLAVDRETALSA